MADPALLPDAQAKALSAGSVQRDALVGHRRAVLVAQQHLHRPGMGGGGGEQAQQQGCRQVSAGAAGGGLHTVQYGLSPGAV